MKKGTLISFILLLGISIALTYYFTKKSDRSQEPIPELAENDDIKYNDTVRLDKAQRYIRKYIKTCDTLLKDNVPIRAYAIHKADLFGMLGVTFVPDCKYEHCGVYIGLDDSNKFRLFMTPTVKLTSPKGVVSFIDEIPIDENNNKYVYDLNAPCPSTCDYNSPLYVRVR